jgi:hypothetical protein
MADKKGFEVGDIDSTPWGWRTVREQPDRIFRFIYN